MNRWVIGVLTVSCALVLAAAPAKAIERAWQKKQKIQHPPRYQRGSFSQWHKTRDRDGNITYRQVYPGYSEKFPPPAFLFYGYPHSGDFTGMGIDGTP